MTQTVLVIDDRRDIAEIVETSLTEKGYGVTIASDVAAGIEKIAAENPDMLILGLALPDAFAMMQRLRAAVQSARLPVILILRAWALEEDVRKGWDLGVDAYLPAEFDRRELLAYVGRIFKSTNEENPADCSACSGGI